MLSSGDRRLRDESRSNDYTRVERSRGRVQSGRLPEHFRDHVTPELRRTPGFLRASLSKRSVDGKIEFLVLTHWSSRASIEAFAGADIARAVVEPRAVAALIDFDDTVRHYECVEEV